MTIEEKAFEELPSLRELRLNDNQHLMFVDRDSFSKLPSVTILMLHNGNLSSIHNVASALPALMVLTLSGNPLVCDCNIKWIQEVNKIPHNILIEDSQLPCWHPKKRRLEPVKKVSLSSYCAPRIVNVPTTIAAYEGQILQIKCEAFGNPQPDIQWMSSQGTEVAKSKILLFEDLTVQDAGKYICIATSKAGEDRAETLVKVSLQQYYFFELFQSKNYCFYVLYVSSSFLQEIFPQKIFLSLLACPH